MGGSSLKNFRISYLWSNGNLVDSFDEEMHKATIRSAAVSRPNDGTLEACMNTGGEGVLSMWDVTTFNNANDYASFIESTVA